MRKYFLRNGKHYVELLSYPKINLYYQDLSKVTECNVKIPESSGIFIPCDHISNTSSIGCLFISLTYHEGEPQQFRLHFPDQQ